MVQLGLDLSAQGPVRMEGCGRLGGHGHCPGWGQVSTGAGQSKPVGMTQLLRASSCVCLPGWLSTDPSGSFPPTPTHTHASLLGLQLPMGLALGLRAAETQVLCAGIQACARLSKHTFMAQDSAPAGQCSCPHSDACDSWGEIHHLHFLPMRLWGPKCHFKL